MKSETHQAQVFDLASFRIAKQTLARAKPIRDVIQWNLQFKFSSGSVICPHSNLDHRVDFCVRRRIGRQIEAYWYCASCGVGGEDVFSAPGVVQ